MAADLLRAMQTPSLAMLLTRTTSNRSTSFDAFARALPHESWFAEGAGMQDDRACPRPASDALRHFGLSSEDGHWFVINPVHLHIARDHLVLTDPRRIGLDESASRALFAAIEPLCRDSGHAICYGDANNWFLRADQWRDLQTATPDASCGHNIDIWMPTGSTAVDWRKLQNEIQMHWHDHPVNQQRAESGLLPVNSVWLWGGATAATAVRTPAFSAVFNLTGWMRTVSERIAENSHTDTAAAELISNPAARKLLLLDQLLEPSLGEDLGEWLHRIQTLEQEWFSPLLQGLKAGALTSCTLILTNGTARKELTVTRHSLRKFWHRPGLTALRT